MEVMLLLVFNGPRSNYYNTIHSVFRSDYAQWPKDNGGNLVVLSDCQLHKRVGGTRGRRNEQ